MYVSIFSPYFLPPREGETMAYSGPERRINKVFVTRNTEYHMKSSTCVAIRDRKSGDWQKNHFALLQEVCGSILFENCGSIKVTPGLPKVGESMYFDIGRCDLITSEVVSIERPMADSVVTCAS
jgi:hypothetical protein